MGCGSNKGVSEPVDKNKGKDGVSEPVDKNKGKKPQKQEDTNKSKENKNTSKSKSKKTLNFATEERESNPGSH